MKALFFIISYVSKNIVTSELSWQHITLANRNKYLSALSYYLLMKEINVRYLCYYTTGKK